MILQRDNECELRPALGHPQKLASLESLCQREEQRREAFIQGVEEHAKKQQVHPSNEPIPSFFDEYDHIVLAIMK